MIADILAAKPVTLRSNCASRNENSSRKPALDLFEFRRSPNQTRKLLKSIAVDEKRGGANRPHVTLWRAVPREHTNRRNRQELTLAAQVPYPSPVAARRVSPAIRWQIGAVSNRQVTSSFRRGRLMPTLMPLDSFPVLVPLAPFRHWLIPVR